VGTQPYFGAASPNGAKVYVANSGGSSVSVINTLTNAVDQTITVGTIPEGVGITPDGTKVCVNNYTSATVSVIT
jgi:YVTN family beta-propeller protein